MALKGVSTPHYSSAKKRARVVAESASPAARLFNGNHGGKRNTQGDALGLPLEAYARATGDAPRTELQEIIDPGMFARLSTSLTGASTIADRTIYHNRRKQALAEAGYVMLNMVPVQGDHVDYLMSEWGFKTRAEMVRVALAHLRQQTIDGLPRLDITA